jgi:predicted transposase/invertase (TIGR01784 family)
VKEDLNTAKTQKIMSPKVDIAFKMLFGDKRNVKILTAFLEVVLGKKIKDVVLLDTTVKAESSDEKFGVLDVKAELANGEKIDIEMQARNTAELRYRISYYSDKMLTEQLGSGDKYSELKPVISIIIVKNTLISESKKCHNVFSMLEKEEHFPFDGLKEIHILDLSRIGQEKNESLANWLEFIRSETEEEFMAVAQKDKVIKLAFGELKVLSADKKRKMLYEARLKEQRDRWSFEDEARRKGMQEGRQEGVRELLALLESGVSLEEAKKKFTVA